jgi:hypothetical protein
VVNVRRSAGVALIAAAIADGAVAQVTAGGEFQVNSYTPGDQAYPAVCADGQGRFVAVWESRGQDGSGNAVRGQRYDRDGAPLGSELAINTYTPDHQQSAAVACSPAGDFVVVWESRGQDGDDYGIIGRRFDSSGSARGAEFQINSTTVDRQRAAVACSDAAGNFVVVWQSYDQDGDGYGIFGQRFDSAGARRGSEFQVNTATEYSQENPAVACNAAGDFVVVWESGEQDGDGYGVFGQRVDHNGDQVGSEFRVNTDTTGGQQRPAIASSDAGGFVVVWESYDDQDGDSYGVFGQRYTSTGAPSGTEFLVNTFTMFSQQKPAIGTDPHGDFTVAWSSNRDGDGNGVFARHFASSGVPAGTAEFQVNSYTLGDQGALSDQGHVIGVAAANGSFLILWQSTGVTLPAQDGSGAGIFAQRYTVRPPCPGDCNGDGMVTIDELIKGVGIILQQRVRIILQGLLPQCPALDLDGNGSVEINELVAGVNAALNGCP